MIFFWHQIRLDHVSVPTGGHTALALIPFYMVLGDRIDSSVLLFLWWCDIVWRHKQECMDLSHSGDWHLWGDFYSNVLRPYLHFRGFVRSRAKCQESGIQVLTGSWVLEGTQIKATKMWRQIDKLSKELQNYIGWDATGEGCAGSSLFEA